VRKYEGIPVAGGSRIGRAAHVEEVPFAVERRPVGPEEVPAELARLRRSVESAVQGLEESRRAVASDPAAASVFDTHRVMLEALEPEIGKAIRAGEGAEHAVASVLREHANRIAALPDPVFSERRQDVLDLEKRLLRALVGLPASPIASAERGPTVVIAGDLTPTETAALATSQIAALVLEHGLALATRDAHFAQIPQLVLAGGR
jgi:phosphoenolpyruvate-protein kinase (PTS system EI component)